MLQVLTRPAGHTNCSDFCAQGISTLSDRCKGRKFFIYIEPRSVLHSRLTVVELRTGLQRKLCRSASTISTQHRAAGYYVSTKGVPIMELQFAAPADRHIASTVILNANVMQ